MSKIRVHELAKELNISSKELITTKEVAKDLTLEGIISNVIKAPGVKVDRKKFLADILVKETDDIQSVIELGPVGAGIDEKLFLGDRQPHRACSVLER